MTLTIELSESEEARLRALAAAKGTDAETAVREWIADLPEATAATWGAQVLAQWQAEGLIGPFGDPDKDSTEVARDLRRSLEAELFCAPAGGKS